MAYYVFDNGEAIELNYAPRDNGVKEVSKKVFLAAQKQYALTKLRSMIEPKQTIYCVLKHRSQSGMMRTIDFLVTRMYDGKPVVQSISYLMAQANGYKLDQDRGGLKIGGCGMDMGFQAVYGLGCALWPNGTDTPHGVRNGVPDSDGGYAIGHSWL